MKPRAPRWPSAWKLEIATERGGRTLTVTNVSQTGLRYRDAPPLRPGDRVRLTVMGAPVPARTVWTRQGTGALNFDRPITPAQLSTLRQFRDFARREGG